MTLILLTTANKDQTEYILQDSMHKIKEVKIALKKVEYEVILRLRKAPEKYGELSMELKK